MYIVCAEKIHILTITMFPPWRRALGNVPTGEMET